MHEYFLLRTLKFKLTEFQGLTDLLFDCRPLPLNRSLTEGHQHIQTSNFNNNPSHKWGVIWHYRVTEGALQARVARTEKGDLKKPPRKQREICWATQFCQLVVKFEHCNWSVIIVIRTITMNADGGEVAFYLTLSSNYCMHSHEMRCKWLDKLVTDRVSLLAFVLCGWQIECNSMAQWRQMSNALNDRYHGHSPYK